MKIMVSLITAPNTAQNDVVWIYYSFHINKTQHE